MFCTVFCAWHPVFFGMPALRFGLVALTPSMSASTYCTMKYTKLAKGTLISTTTRYSPLHPRSPYRMSAPVSCYGNVRLETDNSIDNTGNSTGSDTDNTDIVTTCACTTARLTFRPEQIELHTPRP